MQQYTVCLSEREQMPFMSNLASLVKKYSFGRAGLMSLTECVAAAASGIHKNEGQQCDEDSNTDKATLLDVFRFIIESSKQHFNPNYRLKVCGKILDATVSVMSSSDVPFEPLLQFISSFPPDFLNYDGLLREKVQEWLRGYDKQVFNGIIGVKLMKKLNEFSTSFIKHNNPTNNIVNYDDEDLEMWELKATRWARTLFLIIEEEHQLDSQLQVFFIASYLKYYFITLLLQMRKVSYKFIHTHGNDLCKVNDYREWLPVKYMILILSIIQEIHEINNRTVVNTSSVDTSIIIQSFTESFTFILVFIVIILYLIRHSWLKSTVNISMQEGLVSYTNQVCSVFWSEEGGDTNLPSSIKGRLGGHSQRRLSSSKTTAVLRAIISVKTLASLFSYCAQFQEDKSLVSALDVLGQLSWKIISCPTSNSETKAEIYLGGYEALHYALKSLVLMRSSSALSLLTRPYISSSPEAEVKPHIDYFVKIFLGNINNLIEAGYLTRARRAILIDWKWMCLESLLSVPKHAFQRGVNIQNVDYVFSDAMARRLFSDLVDSLENAGEGSVLPMLRSARLVLDIFAVSSCDGIDVQMFASFLFIAVMWHLVRSSWLLHVSCNKRRIAPIAALLSSVLHDSVFSDMDMHEFNNTPGPLKWFVEKLVEEGTRSPRTIRLVALHLTGLWLLNPSAIKYYMKELKLLTLYGSVAFDEDFEAEVTENHDARTEVSILSTSSDPELTEVGGQIAMPKLNPRVFINTELYARVSVAVMLKKLADLADMMGSNNEIENNHAYLQSGKLFLLELLRSVVSDPDLAKELYKKYSAVSLQPLCVMLL
ncbi:hypothetical protein L1987_80702 [Smallanthus sonchifolius]|uniref:Uncharacterized protein n=1 Tax=Smallanthus sonchifolius TaxID=185202 RepID=A0ACB8YP18_9ASTR|nr:hypothetical protein L1987_80702 [Smallanthus sonchifolius]